MPEHEDIAPLLKNLQSDDLKTQLAAVKALAALKDTTAVEPLINMLKIYDGEGRYDQPREYDSNKWLLEGTIQREVLRALGEIGDERAVKPLIAALQDATLLDTAAEALSQIGNTEAIDAIIKLLLGTNKWWDEWNFLGKASKTALQKIGEPAIQRIIYLLKIGYPIPSRLPEAFVEIAPERAFEPLMGALNTYSKNLKGAIIEALAKLGDKRAIDYLLKELENKPNHHEHAIVSALGRLGWEGYDDYLYGKLYGGDARFRYTAAHRLLDRVIAGEVELFDEVISLLNAIDNPLVYNLSYTLSSLTDPRLAKQVIQIANHPREDIREGVARALEKMASPDSVEALISMLNDSLPRTRWFAATALGKIGDERALEPLKQRLTDEDFAWLKSDGRRVCDAAAQAIAQISTPK